MPNFAFTHSHCLVTPPIQPRGYAVVSRGYLTMRSTCFIDNFFFRDERDRLLNGHDEDWSDCKKRQLLQAHWGRDRTKKRRHRKSHGQISFISLSKEISARWKKLTDEHKNFYREVASLDFARFQNETKQMSDGHN